VLLVAEVPLAIATHQLRSSGLSPFALIAPYAIVGVIVARRQPRNPIGWLMLAIALTILIPSVAGLYGLLAFTDGHPGLPAARLAVALAGEWTGFVALLPVPVLLFPDGRVPERLWRAALVAYSAVFGLLAVGIAVEDRAAFTARTLHLDSSGELATLGSSSSHWHNIAAVVAFLSFVVFALASVTHQVRAFRHASGSSRAQLKWLMAGGVVSLIGFVVALTLSQSVSNALRIVGHSGFVAIVGLPLGIGIGILRYRLYEIDRLISRTISYTIVTGALLGLFLGLVLLATRVLPFSSPVAVAASTLAAAALFNPLRRRVQRVVDRRFNRARYGADAIVATFGRRLRQAVELDAVRASLFDAVHHAVEPTNVTLWRRSTP
jgi:hypothetical protein